MNRITAIVLGLIFSVTMISALEETEERFNLKFPDLSSIQHPEITEFSLDNGMYFLLCEDNDYPTISVNAYIKSGSYFDDEDKIGTFDILTDLIRSGGTNSYSSAELNNLLDNSAISISSSSGIRSARVNMSALSEDTEAAFSLLKEILRYPVFEEDAIRRVKIRENSSIARRNDEISGVAIREYLKLVFGEESPYARQTEYHTISAVTREDLVFLHEKFFQPKNIYMSIVGSYEIDEMKVLLTDIFGDWKNNNGKLPSVEPIDINYTSSVNLIPREDAEQSWIVIGHITEMMQNHPDYITMLLLNDILGGGFSSRIYRRVRNQMGLAYAPTAYYSVYFDFPGAFYLISQTKSDKTIAAIKALIDEVKILQQERISDEELRFAKESYLNSYIFNYDSKDKIVRRRLVYQFWDYPQDFMDNIKERINEVTIEDIQRVAKQYLRPDDFIILAVGNEEEFDEPLSQFGEVNRIDISIPKPQTMNLDINPHQITRGQEIFQSYLEKMGDSSEIKRIKIVGTATDYEEERSSTVNITTFMEFPDKFKQLIATPNGDIAMIYNQGEAVMVSPAGRMSLPGEFAGEILSNLHSNPIGMANHFYKDYLIYFVEEKRIADKTFNILSFVGKDQQFLLFFEKETMLPYQSIYDDTRNLEKVYMIFENYKKIDGVYYPHRIERRDEKGNLKSETDYISVEFNLEFNDETFKTK